MRVEIIVKVDGQVAQTHVQDVSGTLEQMEETLHSLGKRASNSALQASVNRVSGPRPLFRKRAATGGTKATKAAPSSGSTE
jgi:hypothetical protein